MQLLDVRYNDEVPYLETTTLPPATVIIIDDGDAGTVSFLPTNYSREEGDGAAVVAHPLTITRVGRARPSGNMTILYSTFNSTATSEDFVAVSEGRLRMDDGVTVAVIHAGIRDDFDYEYPGAMGPASERRRAASGGPHAHL